MVQLNLARSDSPGVVPKVQGNPDYHYLYKMATLLRLFKQSDDGRNQFWGQVPGLQRFFTRASLVGLPLPATDIILDHFLLEFEDGWVSLFGGTKESVIPWIFHAVASFDFPSETRAYWPTYWYTLANTCMSDDQAAIGGSSKPITFLGHSLGGATAVCSAYLWGLIKPPGMTAAVTFGCPKARAVHGMSPVDFIHWRVTNWVDVVPFLPFNLTMIPLRLFLLKIWAFELYHYGYSVRLLNEGEADTITPFSALPLIGLAAAESTFTTHPFFLAHFMDAYAHEIRWKMERLGLRADPWYDMVNAFMNDADGRTWEEIRGFPAQSPPPLPDTYTPPAEESTRDRMLETLAELNLADSRLLNPPPALAYTEGQSLAAYISQLSGESIADVEVRLSRIPVADPANVTLASFEECGFNGYQRCGGLVWRMATRPTWPVPKYATRAIFSSTGPDTPETAYAWYMVAIKQGSREELLLQYQAFPLPFDFNRQRSLAIEVTVFGARA